MQEINQLIEQLVKENNKYYITNICIEIVHVTFDMKKHIDPKDIRILKIYDLCIEVLTMMNNTYSEKFETGEEMIRQYKIELEKI